MIFFKKIKKKLFIIYIIRFTREIANKLALIFVPLFLFQSSAKVELAFFKNLNDFQKGIMLIGFYFLLMRVVTLLSAMPIGKFIAKAGIKNAFLLSHLCFVLHIYFLNIADKSLVYIWLSSAINGLQMNLFWNSYHQILSGETAFSKMGKNLGIIQFFLNFITMISPAIGGFLIVNSGYSLVFTLAIACIGLGFVVTFLLPTMKINDQISWDEFFSWISERRYRKLALSFVGKYFNDAALTVWPLYVFIILGSTDKVGFLYSFSLFLAVAASFFIGEFLDSNKRKNPFVLSGGVLSLLWLLRTQVFNIWHIAIVDGIEKLFSDFHWMFFDRMWLLRGKGSQALSYFVYREVIISAAALFFWFMFILAFMIFDFEWNGLFIFALVGVFLSLLVSDKK